MKSLGSDEPGETFATIDYRQPRDRRRFYLDRGIRKSPREAGSDLRRLMALPRAEVAVRPESVFGDVPAVVVGGVAARAYAPERATTGIDVLVDCDRLWEATRCLQQDGWRKRFDRASPQTSLGLRRAGWGKGELLVDVISTDQDWGREALRIPAFDQSGLRVIPLPFLVLMKLDSARGVDQGDLTRMLGRLNREQVDAVVAIVERYSHDPQAAEDVRQYAFLGQIEWDASA